MYKCGMQSSSYVRASINVEFYADYHWLGDPHISFFTHRFQGERKVCTFIELISKSNIRPRSNFRKWCSNPKNDLRFLKTISPHHDLYRRKHPVRMRSIWIALNTIRTGDTATSHFFSSFAAVPTTFSSVRTETTVSVNLGFTPQQLFVKTLGNITCGKYIKKLV